MIQLFRFSMMCLWVVGTIGGIGYTLYYEAWLIAGGIAALAFMSWSTVRNYYKHLTDGDDA